MNEVTPTVPVTVCVPEEAGLSELLLTAALEATGKANLLRRPRGEVARALTEGAADAALVCLMDLQLAASPLTIIPVGCASCCERSLTVQLFSRVRPDELTELRVRGRHDTCTVLARLIWLHNYGRRLDILPLSTSDSSLPPQTQAVLVADKTSVPQPPVGFDYRFDLGSLWFEMTGLPLVLSVWAAGSRVPTPALRRLLLEARRLGQQSAATIAERYGPQMGWTVELAVRYLTRCLHFDFADEHVEGMEEFFDLAQRAGIIENSRPLRIYRS